MHDGNSRKRMLTDSWTP